MTDFSKRAVEIYDAFTHEHHDRRTLLKQMTALAGSVAAAEALILGIAASPAAAEMVKPDDVRLTAEDVRTIAAGRPARAYAVRMRASAGKRLPIVLVIHENRGLTPHIRDVARRVALAGFWAIAPDLLAPHGGTPADEDRARALIGTVDYDLALAQARASVAGAAGDEGWNRRAGVVGFCWGGAFVHRLAIGAPPAFRAGVSYYGPAPAPSEAAKVTMPLMIHLAGTDARVNTTGLPWAEALKAANRPVEAFTYEGADHAFNNHTSAERYDKAAADLAWSRTIAFLHKHLDA